MLIGPRGATLWLWSPLSSCYSHIILIWAHSYPNGATDWGHSAYICPRTSSMIATPGSNSAKRNLKEDESGLTPFQRRPQKDYAQHAKAAIHQTVRVHWSPIKENLRAERLVPNSDSTLINNSLYELVPEWVNLCWYDVYKNWPNQMIETLLSIITIDKSGISNIIWINHIKLSPALSSL